MSASEVAIVVAAWALFITPWVITGLKGQIPLFFAGLFFGGLVWLISACRLARPNSWWAAHRYGAEKMQRSQSRYPEVDPGKRSPAVRVIGHHLRDPDLPVRRGPDSRLRYLTSPRRRIWGAGR